MQLKDKIKTIRLEKGMNMKEFGLWLGISESMVSYAESGERNLNPKILRKLNLSPTISVQRTWIERLVELHDLYENSEGDQKTGWLNHLLGYIESAKELNK